jgi:hypothetical protein
LTDVSLSCSNHELSEYGTQHFSKLFFVMARACSQHNETKHHTT